MKKPSYNNRKKDYSTEKVRAKKHLGQHFLNDKRIAADIVHAIDASCPNVLEVGPGMGVLTQFMLERKELNVKVVELDIESVAYLTINYPALIGNIFPTDFLQLNFKDLFNGEQMNVVGNFPYNISSQIVFKIIEERKMVPQMVGMFQKEVADRIAAPPGSKVYGITSILTQAFYEAEVIFEVPPTVFSPPPKVQSAVLVLRRKEDDILGAIDERLFFRVVKTAFNQRRKTLRNTLKPLQPPYDKIPEEWLAKRPEQLGLYDFLELTRIIQDNKK